jgi:hypothetical protein
MPAMTSAAISAPARWVLTPKFSRGVQQAVARTSDVDTVFAGAGYLHGADWQITDWGVDRRRAVVETNRCLLTGRRRDDREPEGGHVDGLIRQVHGVGDNNRAGR